MSILNSLYNYIKLCPLLQESSNGILSLKVDYSQSDNVTSYSINETVCKPELKTYVNGDSENQFIFTLTSIEHFGSDEDVNITNIYFYEQFAQWLKSNSFKKILPTMEEGQTPSKIKALTGGYLFDNAADATTARYCIQVQLIYDQKNNI